jgi:hypothetical protein
MTLAPKGITIGVIGTAGRREDRDRLNLSKYQQMKASVLGLIAPYTSQPITFVSGGAAVADHIAVQLFLALPSTRLRLHLPAEFDMERQKYVEVPGKTLASGNVANYYHRQFWKRCQQPSLAELHAAIHKGAEVTVTPNDFKGRNTKVANDADIMIALTFGDGPELKDGGTRDCMEKFLRRRTGTSFHMDLHTMAIHSPAVIPGMEQKAPETPDLL